MNASLADSPDLSLIPFPAHVELLPGRLTLQAESVIHAPSLLEREAAYLAGHLRSATGFPFAIVEPGVSGQRSTSIKLSLDPGLSALGGEGYRLIIGAETAEIRSVGAAGIFYGIQTLLQLFPPAIFGRGPRLETTWSLPQVKIEDFPRFSWRGAMLDCSRHCHPVAFIHKFIDTLAHHKLNTFHWHLTDDQGWRIEIKKYPRLTEVGAWRRGTWRGHYGTGSGDDGIPHGGFYTQEEIREIVRHAADRHITIVPEIEMPGHAQAALAAYPEFGCTGQKVEVWTQWGISEHLYSPTEKTFQFLQDVLTEVMALFPGTFIHVGGDEAVKKQWDESPEIRALMAAAGAKDSHEMQSYFIRRFDRFLAKHGRRLIGWDEILEGGLAEGAAVMSWRGIEGGIAAAKSGHDAVMAPHSHTYLDHGQSASVLHEPLAMPFPIGGFLPIEKVYGYDPMPAELPADKARHILGVQGHLWSEYLPTPDQVEYMAFPRLAALADTAWSSLPRHPYASFLKRLETHLKRLDVLGVNYRPPTPSDDPQS